MQVLIGTTNRGKFSEIMEVLGELPYEFLKPFDLGLNEPAPENGETHEENARQKAEFYFIRSGILTLAEDSGIMVDALAGELGVKTRRWGAGEQAGDEEWIKYFLEALRDVPESKRGARFVCVGAATDGKGDIQYFRGETNGIITKDLQAPIMEGLPISSCFKPDGFDRVYAALSVAEKNSISHRGKAMKMAKTWLKNLK
jgi:XTP/dITP diphosphohydrolase